MKRIALLTAVALLAASPVLAAGDAKKGAKVFKKCKSCHTIGDKTKHKVGPNLNNIMGKTAGTAEGFKKYSKNMVKAGEEGLVWNEEKLAEFLKKPKDMIKKTKMSFKGLKKQKDIENVIAFLKEHSPDYKPAE